MDDEPKLLAFYEKRRPSVRICLRSSKATNAWVVCLVCRQRWHNWANCHPVQIATSWRTPLACISLPGPLAITSPRSMTT